MAFVFVHNRKRKNILFCSVTLFLHLQNLLYLRLKSPQAFLPFRFNFVCFCRSLPLVVCKYAFGARATNSSPNPFAIWLSYLA